MLNVLFYIDIISFTNSEIKYIYIYIYIRMSSHLCANGAQTFNAFNQASRALARTMFRVQLLA